MGLMHVTLVGKIPSSQDSGDRIQTTKSWGLLPKSALGDEERFFVITNLVPIYFVYFGDLCVFSFVNRPFRIALDMFKYKPI